MGPLLFMLGLAHLAHPGIPLAAQCGPRVASLRTPGELQRCVKKTETKRNPLKENLNKDGIRVENVENGPVPTGSVYRLNRL